LENVDHLGSLTFLRDQECSGDQQTLTSRRFWEIPLPPPPCHHRLRKAYFSGQREGILQLAVGLSSSLPSAFGDAHPHHQSSSSLRTSVKSPKRSLSGAESLLSERDTRSKRWRGECWFLRPRGQGVACPLLGWDGSWSLPSGMFSVCSTVEPLRLRTGVGLIAIRSLYLTFLGYL
jgi:hypothetical protein